MKIKILNCEEVKFPNGNVINKVVGLVCDTGFGDILQIVFTQTPYETGKVYNVRLTNSDDFKTLKIRILDEFKDSSKQGIFNK